jgi:hypothetical protein
MPSVSKGRQVSQARNQQKQAASSITDINTFSDIEC